MRTMDVALLMTLLVGCGSDPTSGSSSPPSTDKPSDTGASANGKTPVTDPGTTSAPPTGTTQTDPGQTQTTPDPKPAAKPTFAWAPDYADFAETMLGDTTKPQTVTLTNTSDVDAADVGLHLNGSQFVLGATDCSGALKAHGSCQAALSFRPTLAIQAEGLLYLALANSNQVDVFVHLTGTGKQPPVDPSMSTPLYPPGTYPMCASPPPPGSDWLCGTAERPLKKDGFICGRCIVGSTQECRPDSSVTLCVASCGECK